VLFADATHPEALDLAGIDRARLVAFSSYERTDIDAGQVVRETMEEEI